MPGFRKSGHKSPDKVCTISMGQCDVILLRICYNYVYVLCTYRPFGVAVATWKVPTMSRRPWSSRPWLPNWCPPEAPFS